MKKFMAIVMCLAMALSMMTVVSFAATIPYVGANGEITVAPGAAVSVPVYITDGNNGDLEAGLTQLELNVPAELSFELVGGTLPYDGDVWVDVDDDHKIVAYNDSGKTYSAATPAFTINVTAPTEVGVYTITFGEIWDTVILCDANFDMFEDINAENIVINVEAEEVEPSIGAVDTTVPSENEGGVLKVLELIGNPTEFGIKYVGEDADYAGTEFPGKIEAETSATYAAVEVIGLDDAFEAYAR